MNEINSKDIPNKLLLVLFYLFALYIFSTIIIIISIVSLRYFYPNNPNNINFASTLTNLFSYMLLFFGFLFILKAYYTNQFNQFKKRFVYFFLLAVAGWFFSYFLNIIIEIIMMLFDFELRDSENQEAIIESFKYPLLIIPMVTLGAPLVEETIFRGVIFNYARNLKLPKKLNIVLAFFLSSSLFGMIHVFSAYLTSGDPTELILGITYISTGFVLTLLYYLTNNIFVPMLAHFFQNIFASIMILLLPYLESLLPEESLTQIVYILFKFLHLK